MKSIVDKLLIVAVFLSLGLPTLKAQVYGPEKIPLGNFGTVLTEGKNGDDGVGASLYPNVNIWTYGIFYQPASKVWYNGRLISTTINPTVVIGKPIPDKSSYKFGMTEEWQSWPYYYFPDRNNSMTYLQVPNAPNNGYYVIANSTRGMYSLPSLSTQAWSGPLLDKYETNQESPTNYFMIVNSDEVAGKVYYYEEVDVEPGQVYRISLDLARLNKNDVNPEVSVCFANTVRGLDSAPIAQRFALQSKGVWEYFAFDYVVPNRQNKLVIGFKNYLSGYGSGNDLAMDNLSMKAMIPQIAITQVGGWAECPSSYTLEGGIKGAFNSGDYSYQWERKDNRDFVKIGGATSSKYVVTKAGTYRLKIYTKSTASYPMYTNTITITEDQGCLLIPKPRAVDDTYYTPADVTLEGDVLKNDSPMVSGAKLTVKSFSIGGASYPVGSIVKINDSLGKLLGTIIINVDGSFNFISVPGLDDGYKIPVITYNVLEEGGTESSAKLNIIIGKKPDLVVKLNVSYDASCVQCPVFVKIEKDEDSKTPNTIYSLYRDGALKGIFNSAGELTFNETQSGTLEYTIQDANGRAIKTFSMKVHPASATWRTDATSTDWNNESNWKTPTGGGSPIWCTDVVMAENAIAYPTLVNGDACRDITFKSGAIVGQIQKLTYRKAFVELNPERNRWYMLSAPLRYMYSADFHGDLTWTNALSPKVFMMYFDVTSATNPDGKIGYSIGNFSIPFAKLEENLFAGKAFALWINGKSSEYSYADDNFRTGTSYKFPRLLDDGSDAQFSYHDQKTGTWLQAVEPLSRGNVASIPSDKDWEANHDNLSTAQKDNRYRFAFEELISNGVVTEKVTPNATNVIGNPFMSQIDFEKFAEDNVNSIYNYYRIWDGDKFYIYIAAGASETWNGLGGLTTETKVSSVSQYISPMQSFFIQTKPGASSIVFKPQNISVAASYTPNTKLRAGSASSAPSNILILTLKSNGVESKTVVAFKDEANTKYQEGEDIEKLFSSNKLTAELYTVTDDSHAVDLNLTNSKDDDLIIPLGIKSGVPVAGSMTVEGLSQFDSYKSVLLKDALLNKEYDLRQTPTVSFDQSSVADLQNRFFVHFRTRTVSGIEDEFMSDDSDVKVLTNNGVVVYSAKSLIKSVEIYDMSGKKVSAKDQINDSVFRVDNLTNQKGIYLLRVMTDQQLKVFKIKL